MVKWGDCSHYEKNNQRISGFSDVDFVMKVRDILRLTPGVVSIKIREILHNCRLIFAA